MCFPPQDSGPTAAETILLNIATDPDSVHFSTLAVVAIKMAGDKVTGVEFVEVVGAAVDPLEKLTALLDNGWIAAGTFKISAPVAGSMQWIVCKPFEEQSAYVMRELMASSLEDFANKGYRVVPYPGDGTQN